MGSIMINNEMFGCDVVANPTLLPGESETPLTGMQINGAKYSIEGGGGGEIDYSTTEQDTGLKWVDGKTIYQKTFYIASLSASGGTTFNLTDSNVNVDKFISYEWNGTRNDGVQTMNDNMILDWGQGSSALCDFVYENNDHIKVKYVSSYYSYTDVYITIRYTKANV